MILLKLKPVILTEFTIQCLAITAILKDGNCFRAYSSIDHQVCAHWAALPQPLSYIDCDSSAEPVPNLKSHFNIIIRPFIPNEWLHRLE